MVLALNQPQSFVDTARVTPRRGINNVLGDFFSAENITARRPLSNFLGTVGDALSASVGGPMLHRQIQAENEARAQQQQLFDEQQQQSQQQQQGRQALGQYLQNPQAENAFQLLAQAAPETAAAIQQQQAAQQQQAQQFGLQKQNVESQIATRQQAMASAQAEQAQNAQARQALGQYLQNPQAENAFQLLAQAAPETAAAIQQQQAQKPIVAGNQVLVRDPNAPQGYSIVKGTERPASGIQPKIIQDKQGGIFQVNPSTGELKTLREPTVTAALSPGQKALDTQFGKKLADYIEMGGPASTSKQLEQLDFARNLLEQGDVSGGATGYLPDSVRRVFNENAANVQQAIQDTVTGTLRPILGAQFTEKEGKRIMDLAFDPRAKESENIRRLDLLKQQLTGVVKNMQEAQSYFDENGTLKGFKGSVPSLASVVGSFSSAVGKKEKTGEVNSQNAPGLKVGFVDGGYRYKGGDPNDQNNWEPVQ